MVQLEHGNTVAGGMVLVLHVILLHLKMEMLPAGVSTRAFVGRGTGAASTVTLSPEKNDIDFVFSTSFNTQAEQILT